jgi:hypothetical protein
MSLPPLGFGLQVPKSVAKRAIERFLEPPVK